MSRGIAIGAMAIVTTMSLGACGSGSSRQQTVAQFTACVRSSGFIVLHIASRPWARTAVDLRTKDRNYAIVAFSRSEAETERAYRYLKSYAKDLASHDNPISVVKIKRRVVNWNGSPSKKERDMLNACL